MLVKLSHTQLKSFVSASSTPTACSGGTYCPENGRYDFSKIKCKCLKQ